MGGRLGRILARHGGGLLCRGCLGRLDAGSEAGICASCWAGLAPLPDLRCPRCALAHDEGGECPEPVAWDLGDALWDYHGGRPPFGALLVPGIKAGEGGWRRALLEKAARARLPAWTGDCDGVVAVPTLGLKRLLRGFDLAEEWASRLARTLGVPRIDALAKHWRAPSQTGRPEHRRRALPGKAFRLRPGIHLEGRTLLLADDVWTTGTTLLRCARLLKEGGAAEVRALALFRAL